MQNQHSAATHWQATGADTGSGSRTGCGRVVGSREQVRRSANTNHTTMRCTEATLRTFGIEGEGERRGANGTDVLGALKRHGWKWQPVLSAGRKLSQFLAEEEGDFYLVTDRHAMAYRNGVLVDTARGTMRRTVRAAVRVYR